MKANHSPLSIYSSSVINKLNTEYDVANVARLQGDGIHVASLQGDGIPSLQSLVDRAPSSGPHLATAVTAVGGVMISLV